VIAVPDWLHLMLKVIWQTAAIYLYLTVALALVGRVIMAQFTTLEYLGIALLGSAVETGLYTGSSTVLAGLTAAFTLLILNRALAELLDRSKTLRRLVMSTPIVLAEHGRPLPAQLRRAGMTRADLLTAIRERGYAGLSDVSWVVLEINGSVSVIPRKPSGNA
jgi:uncharacterized membrane protein YcaP (DUF421 family)